MILNSFFIRTLFLSIISVTVIFLFTVSSAEAQVNTITDFSPSNFTIVDKTINAYGPPGISSFVSGVGGNPNRYRLTDTFGYQRSAIWYTGNIPNGVGKTLDLSKDFVASFRLSFGNGKFNMGIADGIVFVLTTQQVHPNFIGGSTSYIGYGDILNSFAVEFDTEFNGGPGFEGGNVGYPNKFTVCHTAYLRNGNMLAIPGTYKPIQDNFSTVRGSTICVAIEWKRVNGVNGNDGYELVSYIQELSTNNMVERNRMWFATLDDFIDGLSQDSVVTWGVMAANSNNPNRYEVEFISLITGDINTETTNLCKTKN